MVNASAVRVSQWQRRMSALVVCLGLCMALLVSFPSQAQTQTKVTVALARNFITPAEEIFTIAVPKQLGYFAEEGLEVEIITTNGSSAALLALVSNSADIAYASSISLASAVENQLPVKAFAGITVKWPYFIAVPKDSPIQSIADLKGKKVGIINRASASYLDLQANLHLAGLTENDVTVIPVGVDAQAAAALRAKQIDALDNYSDSFTNIQNIGIELRFLPRPEKLENLFSVTMITRTQTLQKNPEVLVRFARAAYKGIIYAQQHPQEAMALGCKEFSRLPGCEDPSSKEAQNAYASMLMALGDSIPADLPDPATWGQWLNISHEKWQALLDFAYETQEIKNKLAPSDVWDDSLMPKIYDFGIPEKEE